MSTVASNHVGTHGAFLAAALLTVVWILSGPLFKFSEGWQLVMNTITSVITFLMVFLLQATQNRDARAIHLKLDELIRASEARNRFLGIEVASDDELVRLEREFQAYRDASIADEPPDDTPVAVPPASASGSDPDG